MSVRGRAYGRWGRWAERKGFQCERQSVWQVGSLGRDREREKGRGGRGEGGETRKEGRRENIFIFYSFYITFMFHIINLTQIRNLDLIICYFLITCFKNFIIKIECFDILKN